MPSDIHSDHDQRLLRSVERLEGVVIREFLDWLYEGGPDPNMVSREKLFALWLGRGGTRAMAEGVVRYVPVDGHNWHSTGPGDA